MNRLILSILVEFIFSCSNGYHSFTALITFKLSIGNLKIYSTSPNAHVFHYFLYDMYSECLLRCLVYGGLLCQGSIVQRSYPATMNLCMEGLILVSFAVMLFCFFPLVYSACILYMGLVFAY